jgi:hypothetical protein
MRRRELLLSVVALCCGAGLAPAQAVKSPADLFPAGTLAFAEFRDFGQLVREKRSLFQGSVLANVPQSLARLQAKYDPNHTAYKLNTMVGMFGLLMCPEVFNEFQRIKGAAIGLTGFGKNGRPEYVAVVLPGGSQAPSFLMRTALVLGEMRPSGRFEGVTLYRGLFGRKKLNPRRGEQPEQVGEAGPVLAMTPGALFFGSPEAVKDAIRRFRAKGAGDSLAKAEAFQQAMAETGKDPGLVAYADVGGFLKVLEGHLKQGQGRWGQALEPFLKMINPKAFRTLAYSWTLSKGTLCFREVVFLDPKEKCPILELYPTKPVNKEVLHFAPADAMLVAALSNGGGAKRWARLLEMGDQFVQQLAQLTGQKHDLPSDMVKQVQAQIGIDLGKDVFGKIANFAFAMGDPLKAPVKRVVREGRGFKEVRVGPEIPMVLVVEATDEQAAKSMVEKLVPKILGMVRGEEAAKPTSKEVHGQTVYTLKLGRHEEVHYGRHGSVLVFGPYQAPVAQALAAGADKKGWLANEKAAALIREPKDPLVLVAFKPVTAAAAAFFTLRGSSDRAVHGGEARPAEQKPLPPRKPLPPQIKQKNVAFLDEEQPRGKGKEGDLLKKELGKLLAHEEPMVLTVTRKKDRIVEECRMGGLKPLVAHLTNFIVEQVYRSHSSRMGKAARPRAIEEKK